ncbi:hypothetical protein CVS53_00628 [Microbacterium oxydans]|nr:hypothetical protein CVS53_00628 [Microbacterium oxydans]
MSRALRLAELAQYRGFRVLDKRAETAGGAGESQTCPGQSKTPAM